MHMNISTYVPGASPVHACDARVKIALLAVYSVTLFFVDTWTGLAVCALGLAAVLAASGIGARRFLVLLVPIYVIMAVAVVCNGFSFDVANAGADPGGLGSVSAGVLAGMPNVPLAGSFGFVPAGFARGCFYAVRILLLVLASLVVSFATTSTDMTAAFACFMRPLRPLRVPVDDAAMVLSLALRFIPVMAEELGRLHDAQWARGASFGEGSAWQRVRAWQPVLIPLFVSLFRRADALAVAMDARCYGAPGVRRTSLAGRRFAPRSAVLLVAGTAACIACACLL